MVEVGTIVGDVQLTITINQSQVTITIESTHATSSDRDKVTVINIVDRCRSITKYCRGVSKYLSRTRRGVTTGKDGIMDNDAFFVNIRLTKSSPFSSAGSLIT